MYLKCVFTNISYSVVQLFQNQIDTNVYEAACVSCSVKLNVKVFCGVGLAKLNYTK